MQTVLQSIIKRLTRHAMNIGLCPHRKKTGGERGPFCSCCEAAGVSPQLALRAAHLAASKAGASLSTDARFVGRQSVRNYGILTSYRQRGNGSAEF